MIYFVRVRGTDHVKIGYSRDRTTFRARIQSLQTGQPWKLEVIRTIDDAEQWMEAWFHQVFAGSRQHGEWFTYNPAMMELLPDFETFLRRQPRAQAHEALTDLIERLFVLLESWTPDADAEPEADFELDTDDEPDADGYRVVRFGEELIPAVLEDDELSDTEIAA